MYYSYNNDDHWHAYIIANIVASHRHYIHIVMSCQGLKFVKFAINLAKGGGGNTLIGAHEAHSNIFLSSQELVRRHCH